MAVTEQDKMNIYGVSPGGQDKMNLDIEQDKMNLDIEQDKMDLDIEQDKMNLDIEQDKMNLDIEPDKMNQTRRTNTEQDKMNTTRWTMSCNTEQDKMNHHRTWRDEPCLATPHQPSLATHDEPPRIPGFESPGAVWNRRINAILELSKL